MSMSPYERAQEEKRIAAEKKLIETFLVSCFRERVENADFGGKCNALLNENGSVKTMFFHDNNRYALPDRNFKQHIPTDMMSQMQKYNSSEMFAYRCAMEGNLLGVKEQEGYTKKYLGEQDFQKCFKDDNVSPSQFFEKRKKACEELSECAKRWAEFVEKTGGKDRTLLDLKDEDDKKAVRGAFSNGYKKVITNCQVRVNAYLKHLGRSFGKTAHAKREVVKKIQEILNQEDKGIDVLAKILLLDDILKNQDKLGSEHEDSLKKPRWTLPSLPWSKKSKESKNPEGVNFLNNMAGEIEEALGVCDLIGLRHLVPLPLKASRVDEGREGVVRGAPKGR